MLYDDLVPSEGQWLCHHGIKGMKWGVRRYQNENGSLTEAGKKKFKNAVDQYRRTKNIKNLTPFRSELNQRVLQTKEYKELQKFDPNGYYEYENERYGKKYKRGIDYYPMPQVSDYDKKAKTYYQLSNSNKQKFKNDMANFNKAWNKAWDDVVNKANSIYNDYLGDISNERVSPLGPTYSRYMRDLDWPLNG